MHFLLTCEFRDVIWKMEQFEKFFLLVAIFLFSVSQFPKTWMLRWKPSCWEQPF